MADRAFYVRKELTDKYVWSLVAALVLGLMALTLMGKAFTTAAVTMVSMCGAYIFVLVNKGRRPVVLLRDDHLELHQGRLVLLRYKQIVSVSRSGKRVKVTFNEPAGNGAKEAAIDVSELEPGEADELLGFLLAHAMGK